MLDDGEGKAVGYTIGTAHTPSFCERWKSVYVSAIKTELQALPEMDADDQEAKEALTRRCDVLLDLIQNDPHKLAYSNIAAELQPWPGHLHMDILPSHQRQGYGKQLARTFLDAAKAEGCSGAYLGMVASNSGAKAFYEACGFRRLPHVLDDGASGEMGRTTKRSDGGEEIYFTIDT